MLEGSRMGEPRHGSDDNVIQQRLQQMEGRAETAETQLDASTPSALPPLPNPPSLRKSVPNARPG